MIHIKNLSKKYNDKFVLDNINIDILDKQFVVFFGPSGCGKSTLINIIADLIKPTFGEIERNFFSVSYVFQEDKLLEWKSVYENIAFVLDNHKEKKNKIEEILKILELQNVKDSLITELSGGQKQRVAIARAFVYDAELIIMDEPFKSLDYHLSRRIIKDFINLLDKNKRTIILVTHNIDEALLLADRILFMNGNPTNIVSEIYIEQERKYRNLEDENMKNIINGIKNEL